MRKIWIFGIPAIAVLTAVTLLAFSQWPLPVSAKFGDCPTGYFFDPRSGVGCKQTYCNDIPSGHWSYEGYCICGSSGSETENPLDANKECYLPQSDASCPGCLAKCVHFNEQCPGEFGVTGTPEPEESAIDKGGRWMLADAFSKFMSIGADLLEAATGVKIKEDVQADAFYQSLVILPSGQNFDLRLFHNNFVWNDHGKYGFEFNLIEIKPSGGDNWVDEWSIGIGLGSVSGENISHDVPGTPISPSVNFSNIKSWFGEKWDGARAWYRDNAPWFLGGGERSPIPGMDNN